MIRNATNYDVLNAGLCLMLFNLSLHGLNLFKYEKSNNIYCGRIFYFSSALFSAFFMSKLSE
jgi:hypothetical protein